MLKKYFKRIRQSYFQLALLGILCLLSLRGTLVYPQSPSSIQIYFFYAEDCQPCQVILQSYFPTLKSMFPSLEVKTFDVGYPAYYEALTILEKKFNRRGEEFPVVFIGDHLLSGEMEVMEKLNPLILEYQVKGGASLPPIQIPSITKPSERTFSVDLAYFYQKGCPKCDRANYLLKYLAKKYPRLNVKEIDLNTPDGKRLNETLSNRLNLPPEKRLIAPSIFIGNDYLSPEEVTESEVEALIRKYGDRVSDSKKTITPPSPSLSPTPDEIKKAEESIVERFKSLGVSGHPLSRFDRRIESMCLSHSGLLHLLSHHGWPKTEGNLLGRYGLFRNWLRYPLVARPRDPWFCPAPFLFTPFLQNCLHNHFFNCPLPWNL